MPEGLPEIQFQKNPGQQHVPPYSLLSEVPNREDKVKIDNSLKINCKH